MKHVIIGGSIAGISAARAIRAEDAAAEIVLLSDEERRPYYRPMITFLMEDAGIDITFSEDSIEKKNVQLVFDGADRIDTRTNEVILTSGGRFSFDRLLIATGSSPFIPDIEGIRGVGIFTLRTAEDALRIKAYAEGRKNAVVLGGGLVGIKAAIALQRLGLEVMVIERSPRILHQRLDRRGSEIISHVLKNAGINLVTGDSLTGISANHRSMTCGLSSGGEIAADLIVVAAGTRPNLELASGTGIRTNRGILIDDSLQTSLRDIYAAGDVAEYTDIMTGRPSVCGLWTNAEEMGRLAGKNMAGANLKYRGLLAVLNSTAFFSIPVISIGLIEPEGQGYEIVVKDDLDRYRKLVFEGDVLVGAVFIGEVPKAGIYTNLIRNRIPIGGLKKDAISGTLGSIDFAKVSRQKKGTL